MHLFRIVTKNDSNNVTTISPQNIGRHSSKSFSVCQIWSKSVNQFHRIIFSFIFFCLTKAECFCFSLLYIRHVFAITFGIDGPAFKNEFYIRAATSASAPTSRIFELQIQLQLSLKNYKFSFNFRFNHHRVEVAACSNATHLQCSAKL